LSLEKSSRVGKMTLQEAIEAAAALFETRSAPPFPITGTGGRFRKVARSSHDADGNPKQYPKKVSDADRTLLRFGLLEIAARVGEGVDTLRGSNEDWAWFERRRTGKKVAPTTIPLRLRSWLHLVGDDPMVRVDDHEIRVIAEYRKVLGPRRRPERVLDLSVVVSVNGTVVLGAENAKRRSVARLERENNETERAYLIDSCAKQIAELGLTEAQLDLDTLRALDQNLADATKKRKKVNVIATATSLVIIISCAALVRYFLKPDTIMISGVSAGFQRDSLGKPHPTYNVTWSSTLDVPCEEYRILRDGIDITAAGHAVHMPGTSACIFEDASIPMIDSARVREVYYRIAFGQGRSRITSGASKSCAACTNDWLRLVAAGVPIAEFQATPEDLDAKIAVIGHETIFDVSFVDRARANTEVDARGHAESPASVLVVSDFGDGSPKATLPAHALRHVYTKEGLYHAVFTPVELDASSVAMNVRVSARGDRLGARTADQLVATVPDNGQLIVKMERPGPRPKNVVHAQHGQRVQFFCGLDPALRRQLEKEQAFVAAWFDLQPKDRLDPANAKLRQLHGQIPDGTYIVEEHTWTSTGSRHVIIAATNKEGILIAQYDAQVIVH
jgi:hypothetical protein